MAKLVRTNTVYVWPKDEESANDYSYGVYTDEEYENTCKEYEVETLEGYSDNGERVEEISASEDSYSSQGEYTEVVDIPNDRVEEIKKIIDDMYNAINKLNKLFQ